MWGYVYLQCHVMTVPVNSCACATFVAWIDYSLTDNMFQWFDKNTVSLILANDNC